MEDRNCEAAEDEEVMTLVNNERGCRTAARCNGGQPREYCFFYEEKIDVGRWIS